MKTSVKLFLKLAIFTYVLIITPFFHMLPQYLGLDYLLHPSVYESEVEIVSVKEQLNMMKINEGVILSTIDESVPIEIESGNYVNNQNQENPITENNEEITQKEEVPLNGKKVYIYNTHQQEGYQDGKTVVDASIALSNQLQAAGIQVVYESNDFSAYLKSQGLDYNSSYQASNYYLNEAFVNYGGFDLVIDFHRDSVPRESSYTTIDGNNYAKMMFVIGGLSKNHEQVSEISNQITQIVNEKMNGVMKQPMTREAYYNQQVYENIVLIEVGSDQNTYEEVERSTNLLGEAIIQYLG